METSTEMWGREIKSALRIIEREQRLIVALQWLSERLDGEEARITFVRPDANAGITVTMWGTEREGKALADKLRSSLGVHTMARNIDVCLNDRPYTVYTVLLPELVAGFDRVHFDSFGAPPTCEIIYEEKVVRVARTVCGPVEEEAFA